MAEVPSTFKRSPSILNTSQQVSTLQNEGSSNNALEQYTQAKLFRNSLKNLKKALDKEVGIIRSMNLNECAKAVAELKDTTEEHSYVRAVLCEFEASMRLLNEKLQNAVSLMEKQCLEPMKNFIDYDFKDIHSLKRQYDEYTTSRSSKTTQHKEKGKKIEEIIQLLNDKIEEFSLKQETKLLEYLSQFWIAMQGLGNCKLSHMDELAKEISTKNRTTKKLVNATKEGHLFIKKKFGWVSNYFILKDGKLIHYRSSDNFLIYDLVICTVRLAKNGHEICDDKSNRFELVVANPKKMKTILLKANSPEERAEWMEKITNEIQNALSQNDSTSKSGGIERRYKITCVNSTTTELSRITGILSSIPGNDRCCDCFSSDPDWAIINMGILVCQRCSGVHRGLGVQISKVRSLVLDVKIWTPELIQLFINFGNKRVNSLLMGTATQEDFVQFRTIQSQTQREVLIKMKYLNGKFAVFDIKRSVGKIEPNEQSLKPIRGHTKAFSITSTSDLISEDKKTLKQKELPNNLLLLKEIIERKLTFEKLTLMVYEGDIANILLAILNDFDINAKDKHGWTLLHYAAWFNKSHICSMLMRYNANDESSDNNGLTPIVVADFNHADEAVDSLTGIEPIPFSINDVNSKIMEGNTFEGLQFKTYPIVLYPQLSVNEQTKHRQSRSKDGYFVKPPPNLITSSQLTPLSLSNNESPSLMPTPTKPNKMPLFKRNQSPKKSSIQVHSPSYSEDKFFELTK
ncbi:gcn4-complementing protein, putative [Entamoeba dispar SAW760]|uniref:Gcn4-complementing protein, putative n=1 Tax=Entamoeba dispar (strain ATCC PRA-260 / SAW760) TaxID=370354 RepID=B0EKK4_ENTDS|nr:gcn4-complementing protein, putative [Entamoeba dispar SAW760]EDR24941.1 gcn4-complementing protein, putative [Entamoeba dispar SAW760]|eukprot:EDR24941.1 gcn4-complementing protein, putative [Entamoeba dispar SAW760]